jgi:hypothetical protein
LITLGLLKLLGPAILRFEGGPLKELILLGPAILRFAMTPGALVFGLKPRILLPMGKTGTLGGVVIVNALTIFGPARSVPKSSSDDCTPDELINVTFCSFLDSLSPRRKDDDVCCACR